jgi:hypothetical protein
MLSSKKWAPIAFNNNQVDGRRPRVCDGRVRVRAQQGSFVLKHQNRRKQAAFENPDFVDTL